MVIPGPPPPKEEEKDELISLNMRREKVTDIAILDKFLIWIEKRLVINMLYLLTKYSSIRYYYTKQYTVLLH